MGRIMLSSLTLVNCFLIKKWEFTTFAYLSIKLVLIHTIIANLLNNFAINKLKKFSCFEIVKLLIKLIDESLDENIAHVRLALRPTLYDEKP